MQFTPFPLFPQERRVMKESSQKLHFKCLKACLFPSGCKKTKKTKQRCKEKTTGLLSIRIKFRLLFHMMVFYVIIDDLHG